MEEKQDFDLETEKVVQALQVCFHYIFFFPIRNSIQFIVVNSTTKQFTQII